MGGAGVASDRDNFKKTENEFYDYLIKTFHELNSFKDTKTINCLLNKKEAANGQFK